MSDGGLQDGVRWIEYGYAPGGALRGRTVRAHARGASTPAVGVWRGPIAVMLLVLGCVIAPLALAGVWFHVNIMDVDGYVATITPVADEPAVQKAVADVLTDQVYGALDVDQILQGSLPAGLRLHLRAPERSAGEPDPQADRAGGVEQCLPRVLGDRQQEGAPHPDRGHQEQGQAQRGRGGLVSLDLVEVTDDITDLLTTSGDRSPGAAP